MRYCFRGVLTAMCLCALPASGGEGKPYPNPARFEKAILALEAKDKDNPPPAGAIVCTGSSTMGGWHKTLRNDLAPLTVIPRGFGGSNMNDLLFYADRVIIACKPRAVLVYEGDNDIACGVSPEKVRDTFAALVDKIAAALPETRIYVLSTKPSIKRWALWPKMQTSNALVRELCARNDRLTYIDVAPPMLDASGSPKPDIFKPDNLHMNEKGYALWTQAVKPILIEKELRFERRE